MDPLYKALDTLAQKKAAFEKVSYEQYLTQVSVADEVAYQQYHIGATGSKGSEDGTPPTTLCSDVREYPGDQELLDHEDRCRGVQAG